jgi:hypothetical protein
LAALPEAGHAGEPLAPPAREIVLLVNGSIDRTTDGVAALFDLPLLESLGLTTFTAAMPGDGGPALFEGVPTARLLEHVGAGGATLTLRTFDDERVEMAVADLGARGAMLAVKRDGRPLDPETQGPVALILADGGRSRCIVRLASLTVD